MLTAANQPSRALLDDEDVLNVAGPPDRGSDDRAADARARQGTARRFAAQKHLPLVAVWPGLQDVVPQRISHVLRQRQFRLPPRLAADPDDGPVPVDVVESQPGDIAGPERQPGEQQQGRLVAQPDRRRHVAGRDHALDVVLSDVPGQAPALESGHRRDRVDKFRPAEAVGPEETQVHPERDRLASYLFARGGFEAAQDRVPDPGRVIRFGVVAEVWEQRAQTSFVLFDRRVSEAAVLSKPVQERIQMLPTLRLAFRDLWRRDDIPVRQEGGKKPEPRSGTV